jgi:geranylgeranyl diphosphate synthase type II
MHSDKELIDIVNSGLEKLEFGKEPNRLYDPVYYSLGVGGKRIRPVLCLMSNELFGGDYNDSLNAAFGIEIFHNFTLLHDDMMDKALVRRGQPVVHIKWNDNIALLSGDAMSVIAYKYISESKNLKETLDVFSDTALKICEGQQYDMDFETSLSVSTDDYLKMINLKTAVLLAAALKIGAISANASDEDKENIYEFGRNLGMAFQLQDDFLDSFGDVIKFGKNIGGDIVANKKTYLLIKALELATSDLKSELVEWLDKTEFNPKEKIEAITSIFNKLNIAKHSEDLMESYFKTSADYFEKINLPAERKQYLLSFTNSLKYRVY